MVKKSVLTGVMLAGLLTAAYVALPDLWNNKPPLLKCESDVVTRKTIPDGSYVEFRVTTLLLMSSDKSLTTFSKGVMLTPGKSYAIDRRYDMTLERVNNSNIYHIHSQQMHKTPEDTLPADFTNQLMMSNINFFWISPIKAGSWMVQGLELPVMVCRDI
ncbi:hypothetical protein ACLBW0_15320 [Enterobacteriaceae bacterium C34A]